MRNRRKYQMLLILWILVLVLAGCASGTLPEMSDGADDVDDAAWNIEAERAEAADAHDTTGAAEAEGALEHSALQKDSFPAESRHWKYEEQEESGEEQTPTMLTVTDHRVNGSMVRGYADRDVLLSEFGFEGQEPFFEYFSEDGALQLELFYEDSCGTGCGLRYYPGEDREPEGFLFNGSGNYRYYKDFMRNGEAEEDPYSVLACDGSDGRDEVEDYVESFLYREDGRPVHFDSRGWLTYLAENREIQKLLEIDWTYREDGTLQEKDYRHNSMIFGTWYCSRQSYYDAGERLVHEHCSVTHGSVDFYYIYAQEEKVPAYCLVIDNNTNLMCAELLEYHGTETEMHYGRIGPALAGETENRYAAAVMEAAEKDGKDYSDYITHTYAADYDGDGMEEAFVIFGVEIKEEYEHDISGACWFVDSNLEASICISRAYAFDMSQEFLTQDGLTYLLLRYSIGFPWQAEIYTVQDNAPVEISGSYADKYVDRLGQVIQIENAYDGNCMRTNVSAKQDQDDWRYLWTGHSWKPYTFLLEHGELREIPAREVTREEVERIAPLPDSFDETVPESIKQFILRDNGELNVNMAVESGEADGEMDIDFSYITYRMNEDGQWEYVEEQMGYYLIQFSGNSCWSYIEALYQR